MTDFPIKSPSACQLKWAWSSVYLNRGTTSSCHRVDQIDLTPENFKNFHNLPKKIAHRQDMIDGKRPGDGCEYCFKIEDAGGWSDRQHSANLKDIIPSELLNNNFANHVTPTILEVYFNNVCNLSCLYCGPWFSTVWENEFKKFGNIEKKSLDYTFAYEWRINPNYETMRDQLWEWMRENSKHLRKFHILGGEPFFQPEFIKCLEHFEEYPNPQCEFVIITNLMVEDKRMDYYIDRFKKLVGSRKLKGLQITASLDCWGPQAEYIRTGLDLAQWERNFEKLLNLKWIRLQINHTVSCLSIKYMPELLVKINEWNKLRPVFISYMTLVTPTWMKPDIFNSDIFKEDFKKILNLIKQDTEWDRDTFEYFVGMKKQIESSPIDVEQIENLKEFLIEIDKRRNTNYATLFPWLDAEFDKYV